MPSQTSRPKTEVLAQVSKLLLGQAAEPAALTLERLLECEGSSLSAAAHLLHIEGTDGLARDALAERVAETLAELQEKASPSDAGEDIGAVTLSKFDLGRKEL